MHSAPTGASPSDQAASSLPSPVLVVEDDPLVLHRLLGLLAQVGYLPDALVSASTLAQGSALVAGRPPHLRFALALVDLGLPDGNGLMLIKQLGARDPSTNIFVVTAWSTPAAIMEALCAGATGYALKERDDLEILMALRCILRGGAPIDPLIARYILELEMINSKVPNTEDHELLKLVAQGLTNREIAEQLGASRQTIECQIKNIYRQLAVSAVPADSAGS